MKRLSVFLVGLLSVVLVFSVSVVAANYDNANVDISFTDALVLDVTGSISFSGITQQDLENAGAGAGGSLSENSSYITTSDTLTVKIWALADYKIGVSFDDVQNTGSSDGLFEITGGGVTNSDVKKFSRPSGISAGDTVAGGSSGDKPLTGSVTDITGGSLNGTPAWTSPASDSNVQVRMDLANLGTFNESNYTSGDYRLDFWVYDGSIPSSSGT